MDTDAVVIGAGPVGLYQVFQLGLLGISCHVIDSLPHAGGQCAQLYADKPIYDIPAVPVCTGAELVERLLAQAAPMKAQFHLGQVVTTLARLPDGRFELTTAKGLSLKTKVVVIAAGVGAFLPRSLKVEGLSQFDSKQVHNGAGTDGFLLENTGKWAQQHVVVAGGGEEAVQQALNLSNPALSANAKPISVTLLHRRDVFEASEALQEALRARIASGALALCIGQPVGFDASQGRLTALQIALPDGGTTALKADAVFVCQGISPKIGPLANWGLALERKQLPVNTATFSTQEQGIFAVGDINTYPGKKKLITCGFHEATLAAYAAAQIVFPGAPQPLQYTTTSPALHRRLGVG